LFLENNTIDDTDYIIGKTRKNNLLLYFKDRDILPLSFKSPPTYKQSFSIAFIAKKELPLNKYIKLKSISLTFKEANELLIKNKNHIYEGDGLIREIKISQTNEIKNGIKLEIIFKNSINIENLEQWLKTICTFLRFILQCYIAPLKLSGIDSKGNKIKICIGTSNNNKKTCSNRLITLNKFDTFEENLTIILKEWHENINKHYLNHEYYDYLIMTNNLKPQISLLLQFIAIENYQSLKYSKTKKITIPEDKKNALEELKKIAKKLDDDEELKKALDLMINDQKTRYTAKEYWEMLTQEFNKDCQKEYIISDNDIILLKNMRNNLTHGNKKKFEEKIEEYKTKKIFQKILLLHNYTIIKPLKLKPKTINFLLKNVIKK